MNVARHTRFGFGAVALGALAIAGCGSGGSSSSTSASAPQASATQAVATTSSTGAAKIGTADNATLGQTILVDAQGRTLYLFEKDGTGQSQCSGACAQEWPAYTTKGNPMAGNGAESAKLGTIKRSDGTTQVTYAGHPLYEFAGDQNPGDVAGNGLDDFGAEWHAVQPSGENAGGTDTSSGASNASSSSTSSSSSGGYGY